MSWVIEFEQPAKRLSMNDRQHWRARNRLKLAWATAAYIAARQSQLRALPPCNVRFTFPVTVDRRRDSDNPAPTTKACVDSFVKAGLWGDDTADQVGTLPSRFAKGAERVVVEIIPRETP